MRKFFLQTLNGLICWKPLLLQIQDDKAKLLFELDNLQSQLEKAQVNSNRFQTEREDFQMDAERQREKCDKLQVSANWAQLSRLTKRCPWFYQLDLYTCRWFSLSGRSLKIRMTWRRKEKEKQRERNFCIHTNIHIILLYIFHRPFSYNPIKSSFLTYFKY